MTRFKHQRRVYRPLLPRMEVVPFRFLLFNMAEQMALHPQVAGPSARLPVLQVNLRLVKEERAEKQAVSSVWEVMLLLRKIQHLLDKFLTLPEAFLLEVHKIMGAALLETIVAPI